MSVRKRATGWQVRVRPYPEQTVPTKTAALRIEAQLKERKALGDLWVETPERLGDVLDRHWERKQLGGKRGMLRPASLRFVAQNLRPWEPLRDVLIPNLRRSQVEDHILARAAVAATSARNELAELKTALRQAEARGQRVDQGIYAIELGRANRRVGRALTVDELRRIAAHMPEHVSRIVLLCGTVGLRWTEATRLTDSMLDLQSSRLTVPARLNKSRRNKTIELSAGETQLLREQLLVRPAGTALVFPTRDGKPYSMSGFKKAWGRACFKAGFGEQTGPNTYRAELRFHDLRHTATSLMCAAGMRPEHVAARRGDSDGGALVLRLYRHLYDGEVARAVSVMDSLYVRKPSMLEAADVS